MKINLKYNNKELELELHYSMRHLIIYEQMSGHGLDMSQMNTLTELINLFYANILATMQYKRLNLDLTYEQFMDFIDDSGMKIVNEFSEWYVSQMMASVDFQNMREKKESKPNTEEEKPSKN